MDSLYFKFMIKKKLLCCIEKFTRYDWVWMTFIMTRLQWNERRRWFCPLPQSNYKHVTHMIIILNVKSIKFIKDYMHTYFHILCFYILCFLKDGFINFPPWSFITEIMFELFFILNLLTKVLKHFKWIILLFLKQHPHESWKSITIIKLYLIPPRVVVFIGP